MKKIGKLKYLGIALSLGIVSITAITMNNRNSNYILEKKTEIPKVFESSYVEEASWNISAATYYNVKATLYTDGLLKISGTGNMKDWESASEVDWANKRDYITKIVIEQGVTGIGSWAFSGLNHQTTIVIPRSVDNLSNNIFTDSTNLKIYCVKNTIVDSYLRGTNFEYIADGDGPEISSMLYVVGNEAKPIYAPDYEMYWETNDVKLIINAYDITDEIGTIEYSFDGGVTWQEDNTKTYADYTPGVKILLKDALGNITEVAIDILIDKTQPTINGVIVQPEGWTGSEVVVTVNAVDDKSGIGQYSFDGGVTWQAENLKGYTQNTSGIEIRVRDLMGHVAAYQTINVTNIDKEGPVINAIQKSTTDWTKDNVTLMIDATDNASGMSGQSYSFDGGATWQESNTKTYTENINGIIIKVRDNIGNITTSDAVNITNIMKLESISVKTMPSKTVYNINDTLNIGGLVLNLIYDNGITEEVTSGFTCTPVKLITEGTQEITVTYMEKTTKFIVEVKGLEMKSDVYKIEGSYISEIEPDTTLDEFKNNIDTNISNIKICDKDGNELKNTDKLCTGDKVFISNEEKYTVVVNGDVNGDSKSDVKDILVINKHRLNKSKLEKEFLIAGDANKDGNVDIKDILQINKFRLGKISSL